MTLDETAQLLAYLQAGYVMTLDAGDRKAGIPSTVKIWEGVLSRFSFEDCRAALEHLRTTEPKRQFGPGVFEFEDLVRTVAKKKTLALEHDKALKRGPLKDSATSELVPVEVKGSSDSPEVRYRTRATKSFRNDYDQWMKDLGLEKISFDIGGGLRGFRYTITDSYPARSAKDIHSLVADLTKAKAMPGPDESYDWDSTFSNLDASKELCKQDYTPIGVGDEE